MVFWQKPRNLADSLEDLHSDSQGEAVILHWPVGTLIVELSALCGDSTHDVA